MTTGDVQSPPHHETLWLQFFRAGESELFRGCAYLFIFIDNLLYKPHKNITIYNNIIIIRVIIKNNIMLIFNITYVSQKI